MLPFINGVFFFLHINKIHKKHHCRPQHPPLSSMLPSMPINSDSSSFAFSTAPSASAATVPATVVVASAAAVAAATPLLQMSRDLGRIVLPSPMASGPQTSNQSASALLDGYMGWTLSVWPSSDNKNSPQGVTLQVELFLLPLPEKFDLIWCS